MEKLSRDEKKMFRQARKFLDSQRKMLVEGIRIVNIARRNGVAA